MEGGVTPPENDEGFWQRQIKLEPRVGAANVTVFGNIVDKEGRFISLTLTDQSNMESVVQHMPYTMWYYNEVSELCGGDLSAFGVSPNNVRKTTTVDVEMRQNTRFSKSNGLAATNVGNKGLPAPQAASNEEVVVCETISDLRALPAASLFEIKIGRAVWVAPRNAEDSGMIVLNGYSLDASSKPVLETKENIFMHGNRNGFDLLIADFAKLNYPIEAGDEIKPEEPVTITGIKRIGSTGKAFYDKLRVK